MSRRFEPATVALAAAGISVASIGVALAGPGEPSAVHPLLLTVVVATAVVGELLPLPRIVGRPVPSSVAVLGTYALLGAPAWSVLAAALVTRTSAELITGRGSLPAAGRLFRAAAAAWIAAGTVGLGQALAPWSVAPNIDISVGSASMLAAAMIVGLPLWEAFGEADDRPATRFLVLLRANWMVEMAMASTAILGAVVHPRLGALVIPFLLLPLLAARSGLRGYRTVRRQHDQTVRAMSRLPEELGEVPADHGRRTAALAAAAARQLGTPAGERTELVQAAQLHELGRIRHEPGEDHSERTIALNGANILQQSGLAEAARIVGAHRDHVLGTGPHATILRLACELDLALVETGDAGQAMANVAEGLRDPEEMKLLAVFDLEVIRDR